MKCNVMTKKIKGLSICICQNLKEENIEKIMKITLRLLGISCPLFVESSTDSTEQIIPDKPNIINSKRFLIFRLFFSSFYCMILI